MKARIYLPILTAVLGSMFAQSASAVDGVINFNGEITANTCTVKLDNNSNGTGVVTLPTVAASALPSVGSVAGMTAFKINLSGCMISTSTTVSTYFEPGAYVNAAGRLTQSNGGGAQNVEIQLLNSAQSAIVAGAPKGSQNDVGLAMQTTDTELTLNYYAQYYATGAVSAGLLSSEVSYTVVYD